jgi:hypothetical protein
VADKYEVMDLAQFLGSIGATVETAVVRDVIRKTLHDPTASPSDLVDTLSLTLSPTGTHSVLAHPGNRADGAAGKIVAFLVKEGEICIEGRQVYATEKFPEGA